MRGTARARVVATKVGAAAFLHAAFDFCCLHVAEDRERGRVDSNERRDRRASDHCIRLQPVLLHHDFGVDGLRVFCEQHVIGMGEGVLS